MFTSNVETGHSLRNYSLHNLIIYCVYIQVRRHDDGSSVYALGGAYRIVDIWEGHWINPCTQAELKWCYSSDKSFRIDKAFGQRTDSPLSLLKFDCKMSIVQAPNLWLRSIKSYIVKSQLLQFNWLAKYKEVHRYTKDIKTSLTVSMSLIVFGNNRTQTINWNALWEWNQHFE